MILLFWRRLKPFKPIKRKGINPIKSLFSGSHDAYQATESHPFLWGKYWLSWAKAREHFLVMGSTGSGKTVLLRRLMQTVLPSIGKVGSRGRRALIYDSKKDMYSAALACGVDPDRVIILNPFDARAYAWDMAADVKSLPEATELANLLIPKENESQPFFTNTARSILRGVVQVLIAKCPGTWTLRHVLLICENPNVIRVVLEEHTATKWLLGLMQKEQTWLDIKSTLDSHLCRFRSIAAAWDSAQREGRSVSIKQFLTSERVLIMGNDDNTRSEMDIINRLFFNKLAQLINSQTPDEVEGKQTWLFLDEVREMGKLNTLHSLLLRARSKNCAVVLGFQDILGMEAVYGEKEARELLGCPTNLALLSLNASAHTARKWASDVVDAVEQPTQSLGTSLRGWVSSLNHNQQYMLKPLFNSIRFYLLGRPGSSIGLEGIFIVPEHRDRATQSRSKVELLHEAVLLSNEELFHHPTVGIKTESRELLALNYIPRPSHQLDDLRPIETDAEDLKRMPFLASVFASFRIPVRLPDRRAQFAKINSLAHSKARQPSM